MGTKMAKLLIACALVTLVTVGALSTGGAPAGAVTCWGDYCSGTDPQTTGCSADGITVATYKLPWTETYLDLRWSPTCKTNWARIRGGCDLTDIRAVQSTGYTQTRSGSATWSRQIYSPSLAVQARATCGGTTHLITAWV